MSDDERRPASRVCVCQKDAHPDGARMCEWNGKRLICPFCYKPVFEGEKRAGGHTNGHTEGDKEREDADR